VCATLAVVTAMVVGRFTLSLSLLPELTSPRIFAVVTPHLFTVAIHRSLCMLRSPPDERVSEPLPDGASGYHQLRVKGQET
jgi:hypothetical protein